ncbi:MAG: FadR family transcriptional regulator [Leptolyngbyaceae cyanobacterium SM1_4_3]|nr:FadR family transcriptional regulator [Leptolyngbyaceae cyanobacterium SM1_4_3]
MSPSSPSTPPARHTAEALLRGAKPTINPLEVTLERLGSAIKMGLYEPGDQLPSERELAQMMGISRSTVREATHLMVEQGILVAKRGRSGGIFVSEHPLPESLMTLRLRLNKAGATLSEILDHRLVVEMGIAELATQRAEELQIKDLQDLVAAMQETYDSVEYRKLDIRFHLLIAKATQTNRLPAIAPKFTLN